MDQSYADLRELLFHELRRCRGQLHTSRDRKRKVRIFEPSRGSDTPLTRPLKNLRFLCHSRPRFPRLLKAALNVFVAEGQTLDDPRDLTDKTKAQPPSIHIEVWTSRLPLSDRGP